jgi:signal transduction histidine kinase
VVELLGFTAEEILVEGLPLNRKVFESDLDAFQQKLDEVKRYGSANFIHRLLHRNKLPVWVHHCLQKYPVEQDLIRGCLLRMPKNPRVQDSCHGAVEPFIHKLANHFTLLQMVVNSLKKELPSSRETEILDETIDRAIELTRGFADCHEQPNCGPGRIRFTEILDGALMRIKPAALKKVIAWQECIDEQARRVFLTGDPFLLDSALGHILQNAVEASAPGNHLMIRAQAYCATRSETRIKICIRDFGAGIDPQHLPSVFQPFFTTKQHHQGLGLTIARRHVELHGGFLRLTSVLGEGTMAEINLPAEAEEVEDLANTT